MALIMTEINVPEAAARIRGYVHRTPVMTSQYFDKLTGARLFFKCENFQKIGAFKFRGASNAILSLSEPEAKKGVITMSSGNHGQAVALAAQMRGIPACVVMPESAPAAKRKAVEGYGAHVTLARVKSIGELPATLARVQAETGTTLIHPYDDPRVISGQGTATLELLEDVPDLDGVIAPVSGGGLLSGTSIAAKGVRAGIQIWGGEPEMADDAYRSLRDGIRYPALESRTMADGLRASLSERTFEILRRNVSEIVTVSEREIADTTRSIWERMKIIVEPSGAVPLAAIIRRRDTFQGKRIGVILSGGNLDLDRLPWTQLG
jgi:threonine dehydratase